MTSARRNSGAITKRISRCFSISFSICSQSPQAPAIFPGEVMLKVP
jgi:hypothetical protein